MGFTSVLCPECDSRERKQYMEDGECRECRGVEKRKRPVATGYVSPVAVERNPERVAHAEQRSRHRIVCGCHRSDDL